MKQFYTKLILGAAAGFLGAVLTDLDAWKHSTEESPFDWSLALRRWIAGAVTGLTAGFGVGAVN